MPDDKSEASEAVTLYLRRFPGKNDTEFASYYGLTVAPTVRARVQALLTEAMSIEPDWTKLDLNGAGDYVEAIMRERHPDLTQKALVAIGNYYTYMMR